MILNRLNAILILLLTHNCTLVNMGVQQTKTIPIAVIGIGLIYIALKLAWKFTGQTEVPAWLRFSVGLIAGVLLLVA